MVFRHDMVALRHPYVASAIIAAVLALIIFASRKKEAAGFLDFNASLQIRGLAILALILGHLAQYVLKKSLFDSTYGNYAVVIFLFLSGVGVVKKYGFTCIGLEFWRNRLLKLMIPLWLTLGLFIFLDYFLLGIKHPAASVFMNFLGLIAANSYTSVNSSDWFITFLLLMYALYFLSSRAGTNPAKKALVLFFASCTVLLIIKLLALKMPWIPNNIGIWCQYLFIFPVSVMFALYLYRAGRLFEYIKRNKFIVILLLLVIFSSLNLGIYFFFKYLLFLMGLILFAFILQAVGFKSTALAFLGKYSYEIYILHFPFMLRYDFILDKKPFIAAFFAYIFLVLFLALILNKISARLLISFKRILVRFHPAEV